MTYKQILTDLKKKQYKPVYFLHGEESYFIDKIAKYIEDNVLSESEKAFNFSVYYGKELDSKTLIDAASRYPMMAPYQVIIVREAQAMRSLAKLKPYIEKPVATTLLVFCHKHRKVDGRTTLGTTLKKHAVFFESKKLYESNMPGWISDYLKQKKRTISADAAMLVAEYLGTDLAKISNELDKLVINLPEGKEIDSKAIETNIGISKDYNVFELQKALGQRDIIKANRIVNYFGANPKSGPIVMVLANLYSYFSKIFITHYFKTKGDGELMKQLGLRSNYFLKDYKLAARNYSPSKVRQVFHLLKEFDLKSKGVNSDAVPPGELMKELVFRILH